jgi:hypothetical protein
MSPIPESELTEMEARAEKATPGPWHSNPDGSGEEGDGPVWFKHADPKLGRCDVIVGSMFWNLEDADFIASARSDLPRLIAEVRRLREALAGLLGVIRGDPMMGGEPYSLRLRGTKDENNAAYLAARAALESSRDE